MKVRDCWIRTHDPAAPKREIWVLPLDHDGKRWRTEKWSLGRRMELLPGDAPVGLRLPLSLLPEKALKRALTLEKKEGRLHVFFPPLLQKGFQQLLRLFNDVPNIRFEGYLPHDDTAAWSKLSLTPDPGVLEINLPPCADAVEYARWLHILERGANATGLRSYKERAPGDTCGTGGGNHLLFGAPSLDMATSVVALGKVRIAAPRHERLF